LFDCLGHSRFQLRNLETPYYSMNLLLGAEEEHRRLF
jgi:hypothetical protein